MDNDKKDLTEIHEEIRANCEELAELQKLLHGVERETLSPCHRAYIAEINATIVECVLLMCKNVRERLSS